MIRPLTLILGLVLTLATLGLGAAANGLWRADPENFRAERIVLPDATMLDKSGTPFRLRGDIGDDALVVINFSYTTCGSICPLGNQILQFVDERRDEIGREVHLLTITIDPANDTPEVMRASAEAFGASGNWHWLTAAPGVIAEILRAADASTADIESHDPVFLVGDMDTGRYFRSLSLPDADELIAMLDRFDA